MMPSVTEVETVPSKVSIPMFWAASSCMEESLKTVAKIPAMSEETERFA